MATTALAGTPVHTSGDLPALGTRAAQFTLTGTALEDIRLSDFSGKRVVLNVFPSVDTGICAASVRKFNEIAARLANTQVICVSKDLPFALDRFCGAEGIENLVTASAFRSSFGEDYGLLQQDGPLAGLLARAVLVIDADGTVSYAQLSDDIKTAPDYDAVLAALA